VTGTQNPDVIFLIQSQHLEMFADGYLGEISLPEMRLAGLCSYFVEADKMFADGGAIGHKPP
jgi:hypothetical protein